MAFLGLLAGGSLFFWQALKRGISQDKAWDAAFFFVLSGIILSRITFVLLNLNEMDSFLDIFRVWEGGLVSYGALLGGMVGIWAFCKKEKLDFWLFTDLLAAPAALGWAIGRIGCFLNWDDYGIASTLPWAVQVNGDVARHPTQLYQIITNLCIFFILLWLANAKGMKKKTGNLFLSFLAMYAAARFLVEFVRYYPAPESRIINQILMILMGAASLAFLYLRSRKTSAAE